jgi:predicted MFS family arabinose efflux permease
MTMSSSASKTWPLSTARSRGSNSWGTAVLGLFAGAAVLFGAFAAVELRVHEPLVDLRLLGRRAMATTNLATVLIGAAMFGVVTLIPRLVQTGYGGSATEAGLVLIPMALVMLIATPLTPRVRTRFGPRAPLRAGAVCAIVSFAALAFADDTCGRSTWRTSSSARATAWPFRRWAHSSWTPSNPGTPASPPA